MTELSDAAKALCKQHYNLKSRSSCNPCPLRQECHRSPGIGSQADLDDWRERVNRIAAKHLPLGPEECRAAQRDIFQ